MTIRMLLPVLLFLHQLPSAAQDIELPAGCDCPTVRLDDDFCASDAVVQGVVLRSDTLDDARATGRYGSNALGQVTTVFQVDQVLKGPDTKLLTVATGLRADACAFNFVAGGSYLVFARAEDGVLRTHQCTHTRAMDTVTKGLLDSLDQVIAGRSWEGGVPVDRPCP